MASFAEETVEGEEAVMVDRDASGEWSTLFPDITSMEAENHHEESAFGKLSISEHGSDVNNKESSS